MPRPTFCDRFHEARQIIKAWNDNMAEVFLPSWISCLDESISIWFSRYTCTGWVYVPRKPHPFGNEYHTIVCGESKIIYQLELVEVKHCPAHLPDPEFHKKNLVQQLDYYCAYVNQYLDKE